MYGLFLDCRADSWLLSHGVSGVGRLCTSFHELICLGINVVTSSAISAVNGGIPAPAMGLKNNVCSTGQPRSSPEKHHWPTCSTVSWRGRDQ